MATSSSGEPKITPHDLVKRTDVEKVLKTDIGQNAELVEFKMVDFTQIGDNYACVVSSVVVKYRYKDKELETSYVVKLNPCRGKMLAAMSETVFKKETGFYTDILPLLNEELVRISERPLRVPRHFYSVSDLEAEVIYLEDLRTSGYKLFPRKKGMDAEHTRLVLQELARLHAASTLLMSRGEYLNADMLEKIPALFEPTTAMEAGDDSLKFKDLMAYQMESGIKIAQQCKGYEKVAEYLASIKYDADDLLMDLIQKTKSQFNVICHGDPWTNNFLFR